MARENLLFSLFLLSGSLGAYFLINLSPDQYSDTTSLFGNKQITLKHFWASDTLCIFGAIVGGFGVIVFAVLGEPEDDEKQGPDVEVSVTIKGHRVISFERKDPNENTEGQDEG